MERTATKAISVKLTPAELRAIDALCLAERCESVSDALITGLHLLLAKYAVSRAFKSEIDKERITHPKRGWRWKYRRQKLRESSRPDSATS